MNPAKATSWLIPEPHCALDVADAVVAGADPPELHHIAVWLGISRQRVQQIESEALERLAQNARVMRLPVVQQQPREHLDDTILRRIASSDGVSAQELADTCRLHVNSVFFAIRRLVRKGRITSVGRRPRLWVARQASDADRSAA